MMQVSLQIKGNFDGDGIFRTKIVKECCGSSLDNMRREV